MRKETSLKLTKSKKHIPQKEDQYYPTPDVPAEDAWADMHSLLDQQVIPDTTSFLGLKKSNFWLLSAGLLIGTLVVLIYWGTTTEKNETTTSTPNKTKSAHLAAKSQSDSNEAPSPVNRYLNSNLARTKNNPDSLLQSQKVVSENHFDSKNKKDFNRLQIALSKNNSKNKNLNNKLNTSRQDLERQKEYTYPKNNDSKKAFEINPEKFPRGISPLKLEMEALSRKLFYRSARPLSLPQPAFTYKTNPIVSKTSIPIFKDLGFGLHWKFSVPFQRSPYFWVSSNAKRQYWDYFIPGVWLSKKVGKSGEIMASATLTDITYYNVLLNSKTEIIKDSIIKKSFSKLLKLSGPAFSIQYNRLFKNHLYSGIGFTYIIANRGLKVESVRSVIAVDSLVSVNQKVLNSNSINSHQWKAHLEMGYRKHKFQYGVAIEAPLTNLIDSASVKNIQGKVFIRFSIK